MNFASIQFLLFMSVVFTIYWWLGKRWQTPFLLAASYGFYAVFNWRFLGVLVLLTLLNFVCGNRIHSTARPGTKRAWLLASLLVSLGVLAYLKYLNFFAESFATLLNTAGFHVSPLTRKIVIPVGVSYYVFQMLTYTLDIYRQQIKPTRSLVTFAAFSSFFAHIVAGPITRARQLIPQLERERRFELASFEAGLTRFLFGFFKKVFIADTLAFYLVDPVFRSPGTFSTGVLWLAAFGYFVQVYADFSGYSSMAIGSARMLGLKIPENFAFPYWSRSIAEFWRRWHISLSSWLRDYLWWNLSKNLPVAGNLWARTRWSAAMFLVFLVCGFWHGASWSFVLWGAVHGAYMVTYDLWHRWRERHTEIRALPVAMGAIVAWLITQAAVGFSWLIFRTDSVGSLRACLGGLLSSHGGNQIQLPLVVWVALAAFVIDHVAGFLQERKPDLAERIPAPVKGLVYATMILFLFQTRPEHVSQFIYFQF
jgi:alginate O-acetyltransferase complex protein AlgI